MSTREAHEARSAECTECAECVRCAVSTEGCHVEPPLPRRLAPPRTLVSGVVIAGLGHGTSPEAA